MKFSLATSTALLLLQQLAVVVPLTNAQTLAEVAASNGLNTLITAATATGQLPALEATNVDLTLFGPTDAAFDALPAGAVNWLLRNDNLGILSQIIGFHLLPGVVRSTDLSDGLEASEKVFAAAPGQGVGFTVNGAVITQADLPASNGVLHLIDQVLIPPGLEGFPSNLVQAAAENPAFETLVQAIGAAGLATTLTEGTFTVFAPVESAWEDLPLGTLTHLLRLPGVLGQVLQYHVVGALVPSAALTDGREIATLLGGDDPDLLLRVSLDSLTGVTLINEVAAVLEKDVETLNGYIHSIDQILIPPGVTIAPTIADVATEVGQFNTLLIAIEAAGLGPTLNLPGPFTVFAPTDTAFDQVDNLDAILANNDLLTLILRHHVVPGTLLAGDLTNGQILTTLAGQTLTVSVDAATGAVSLNGSEAQVVMTDIVGSNGVVHGISGVLIPDSPTPPSTPTTPTMPTSTTTPAPVMSPAPGPGTSATRAPTGSAAATSSLSWAKTMFLSVTTSSVLLLAAGGVL